MRVRIALTDTGTGSLELIDCDIAELTLKATIDGVNKYIAQREPDIRALFHDVQPMSWISNTDDEPTHYAFIYRWHDAYFGDVLVHGVVYTQFV